MIAKIFGIAKTFSSYSANFFRHDKSLRADGDAPGARRDPTSSKRADAPQVPQPSGIALNGQFRHGFI
jgi:hypothetical protein